MNKKILLLIIVIVGSVIAISIYFYTSRNISTTLITPQSQQSGEKTNDINKRGIANQTSQTTAPITEKTTKTQLPQKTAQPTPEKSSSPASAEFKKYLMAFHACNTNSGVNCNDPRNHQSYLVQSDDGAAWSLVSGSRPIPGSVPSVIRRGNTLYIYNPGTVTRLRIDTGQAVSPVQVSVIAADGSNEIFVDPDLIIDQSGHLVLFYLPGFMGGDPAHCPPGLYSCTKMIKSATEVQGSDGTRFTVDDGERAKFSISGQETASDPDIFKGPNGYVLYVSRGPSVEALTSSGLRGTYTDISTLPGGILVNNAGGVPAGYYDPASATYWTYITSGDTSVIKRAESKNISSPLSFGAFHTVLSGSSVGLGSSFMVASPDVSLNK